LLCLHKKSSIYLIKNSRIKNIIDNTNASEYHAGTIFGSHERELLSHTGMDPSPSRRIRWAINGALILALLAVFLGGLFTVVIGFFTGRLSPEASWQQWLGVIFPAVVIWGIAALPFGAALGFFASLIWREV
jgi:hypothetical protein